MGARVSAPGQTGPRAHAASGKMGTGSFPGEKSGQDVTLTPNPLLVPWSRKGRAIPLLPLWPLRPVQSLSACTGVHFTFTFYSLLLLGTTYFFAKFILNYYFLISTSVLLKVSVKHNLKSPSNGSTLYVWQWRQDASKPYGIGETNLMQTDGIRDGRNKYQTHVELEV